MTTPIFQAIGTRVLDGGAVSWPAHDSGDIGILVVTSTGWQATTPSGWTLLDFGQNSMSSGLSVFWRRATSSSETAPVVDAGTSDSVIYTVRGTVASGLPYTIHGDDYAGFSPGNALNMNPFSSTNLGDNLLVMVAGCKRSIGTITGCSYDDVTGLTTHLANTPIGVFSGNVIGISVNGYVTFTSNPAAMLSENFQMQVISFRPAVASSSFASAGASAVSNPGSSLFSSSFVSAGASTVSNPGSLIRFSSFISSGVATVSNPGAHKFRSAFSSAGVATAEMVGNALVRSSFNAAGTSTAIMVGAGNNASSFSSISSSSANMVGASVAASDFSSEGQSLAQMFSPSVVSSSFSASGSSTAQMFSPTVTVITLTDGSGGQANGQAIIDHSICDFAEVILEEGVGTYSIEHVNLIPGKWITVTLVNQGASGSLIWNNGDAPVDWSPGLPPDLPADGETLDLEFFVRRDRSVIKGRKAFV